MTLTEQFRNLLTDSRYLAQAGTANHRRERAKEEARHLSDTEIAQLSARNNICRDWNRITVHREFSTENITGNYFSGDCYLGLFNESDSMETSIFHEGIYSSHIHDSIIESRSSIHNCSCISKCHISSGSEIVNSFIKNDSPTDTIINISIGPETGERSIMCFPDMNMAIIESIISSREFQESCLSFIKSYRESAINGNCISPFIGRNCRIRNSIIENCQIFDFTEIEDAGKIKNSILMSTEDEPCHAGTAVQIYSSVLQEGAAAESGAIIESSLVMEHSHLERHCKIKSSIIGPNSSIGEGEVTSTLAGPFTAAHHQSMLIAAIWPGGRGNVGYGANVGSNHTSRLPDQELLAGEGMFWGLGCSIKFPANYMNSPYSIVSTGVTTLPQKVDFPFSLINECDGTAGMSPAINELVPAWVLSENTYSIFRNENKYRKRNMARRDHFDFSIIREETVHMMISAREKLKNIETAKDFYTDKDIDGIGKNYLTEKNRKKGLETYSFFIKFFCLRGICHRLGNLLPEGTDNINERLFSATHSDTDQTTETILSIYESEKLNEKPLMENLKEYIAILDRIYELSLNSKMKDFRRGTEIIDNYALYHSPPESDIFLKELKEEFTITGKRVAQFIEILCNG